MHIPRQTRIFLITDERSPHREFVISGRMVVSLAAIGSLLVLVLLTVLVSYAGLVRRVQHVGWLRERVEQAEADAAQVDELKLELERNRLLQERLLTMLGVQPSASNLDSLAGVWPASGTDRPATLQDLAAGIVMPPPSLWPTSGYVTQEFTEGALAQGKEPHPGIDIAGPENTPIMAAGDGWVARTGTDPFLGSFLEVQHGLGYLTVYGHCNRIVVEPGASVRRGQVVAYTGKTGQAAAPHLHFEVWHDGEAIDPRQLLRGEPPQT